MSYSKSSNRMTRTLAVAMAAARAFVSSREFVSHVSGPSSPRCERDDDYEDVGDGEGNNASRVQEKWSHEEIKESDGGNDRREVDDEKLRRVRESVFGRYVALPSPLHEQGGDGDDNGDKGRLGGGVFGVYADWTASGRALTYIEDVIRDEVHPCYGNTHTSASFSGFQSSAFLAEARQRVAVSFNARVQRSDAHSDIVLFTGAGATSALNHLVNVLRPAMRAAQQCVVLVGPAEHHSNLLPWREAVGGCGRVVEVPLDEKTGTVCIPSLVELLQRYTTSTEGDEDNANRANSLVIGAFSAASNVTGIAERVVDVARTCRRFGALCCIDAASAAASLDVDMNPSAVPGGLDAIAFSGHKLPGGVGTPGVLIMKKRLLKLDVAPTRPGGGTVFFVTSADHRYLSQREDREEGGSRDLVGIARLAIALQVKKRVGINVIAERDAELVMNLIAPVVEHPRVVVLGPGVERRAMDAGDNAADAACGRLPVVSFLILAPPATAVDGRVRFLHYGFVCSLLNDLFGIQTRGGCVCSGPFAHQLLGLRAEDSAEIERLMIEDTEEVLRPGFTRVSINYLASDSEVAYIRDAIMLVATYGWRMLPHYQYIHKTGEWKHTSRVRAFPERRWLAWSTWPAADSADAAATEHHIRHASSHHTSQYRTMAVASNEAELEARWREQLEHARLVLAGTVADDDVVSGSHRAPSSATCMSSAESERMRWFLLPGEASLFMRNAAQTNQREMSTSETITAVAGPIHPKRFPSLSAKGAHAIFSSSIDADAVSVPAFMMPPLMTTKKAAAITEANSSRRTSKGNGENAERESSSSKREASLGAHDGSPEMDDSIDATSTSETSVPLRRATSRKYPLRGAETASSPPPPPPPEQASNDLGSRTHHENGNARIPGAQTLPMSPRYIHGNTGSGDSLAPETSVSSSSPAVHTVPSKKLLKAVVHAICEWKMIRDGDRVLVGLSGGKDSLCLLHCLLHIKRTRRPPISFELGAATVDPGTDSYNPRPLIPYLASLGVPYHYIETPIMELAASGRMQGDSICAFCSRMRRGALYTCCRGKEYNVLALGQHLDDLAESFIMSVFHNSKLRTMKAAYTVDAGDLRVIRPLMHVRESATREFSYNASLPVIADNCPACFSAPQERYHVKKLLAKEESLFPNVYSCIARAMTPLYDPELQEVIDAFVKAKREKMRKPRPKQKPIWSRDNGGGANGNGRHHHEHEDARVDPHAKNVLQEDIAECDNGGSIHDMQAADVTSLRLEDIATEDILAELARRGSQSRRRTDDAFVGRQSGGGVTPVAEEDDAVAVGM